MKEKVLEFNELNGRGWKGTQWLNTEEWKRFWVLVKELEATQCDSGFGYELPKKYALKNL